MMENCNKELFLKDPYYHKAISMLYSGITPELAFEYLCTNISSLQELLLEKLTTSATPLPLFTPKERK